MSIDIRGSRRKVSIELETPDIIRKPFDGVLRETLVSPGHICNYCHGQGEVMRESEDTPPEWEYKPCPVCGGSGELDAVISIVWKPNGRGLLRNILEEEKDDNVKP